MKHIALQALFLSGWWFCSLNVHAQVYEKLRSFSPGSNGGVTGVYPAGGLVQGPDGSLYGMTQSGGAQNHGTIYRIFPGGQATSVVEFSGTGLGNKGSTPRSGLIVGRDGNFYGCTSRGGERDSGTVFRVSSLGAFTTISHFFDQLSGWDVYPDEAGPFTLIEGLDGGFLVTGGVNGVVRVAASGMPTYLTVNGRVTAGVLTLASDGTYLGTRNNGGAFDKGMIFRMTDDAVIVPLVEFSDNGDSKGREPVGPLIAGSDGCYYGITRYGGTSDAGTVFKVTLAGVLTTLHEFAGDGVNGLPRHPCAALLQASDGNFYGTTREGGAGDWGTVFRMTPAGVVSVLAEFTNDGLQNRGSRPEAALIETQTGVFYGTTSVGGASGTGTVFQITAAGVIMTLIEFGPDISKKVRSGPIKLRLQDGTLYGVREAAGDNDHGGIFQMLPSGEIVDLVQFSGASGSAKGRTPNVLMLGGDGFVYGTTAEGGSSGNGTVFKLEADNSVTTLIEFTGDAGNNRGAVPNCLVDGNDGFFYGTTLRGGMGHGTVFKMTPGGTLATLVQFEGDSNSNRGSYPVGIVSDGLGSFFGTTFGYGTPNVDTIFKITSGGAFTTLIVFNRISGDPLNGFGPTALVRGPDGNFYGGVGGHETNFYSRLFRLTPAGVFSTVTTFAQPLDFNPFVPLVVNQAGDLFGIFSLPVPSTERSDSLSAVMRFTTSGTSEVLARFSGNGLSNRGTETHYADGFYGGLIIGQNGLLYGATSAGGRSERLSRASPNNEEGGGTVYRLTTDGLMTILADFSGSSQTFRGPEVLSTLSHKVDGTLIGTKESTFAQPHGVVYEISPGDAAESTLVQFTGITGDYKGSKPRGRLVTDAAGNRWGCTERGGVSDLGTIFKLAADDSFSTIIEFTGGSGLAKGASPAALSLGQDGHVYGVTEGGGAFGKGTVFKLSPAGVMTTLVEFTGSGGAAKGCGPLGALCQTSDGSWYGTTPYGGSAELGTVFKIAVDGQFSTLVEFQGGTAPLGTFPYGGLVVAGDGNLYGSTYLGGKANCGTLFRLTPEGALTTLVDLADDSDLYGDGYWNIGKNPVAPMILGTDGALYGVTQHGGLSERGVVFRMNLSGGRLKLYDFSNDAFDGFPETGLSQGVDGNIYGTSSSAVFRLLFAGQPLVHQPAIQSLGSSSATIMVQVNPRGATTTVMLEAGLNGVDFPISVAASPLVSGFGTSGVSASISGLVPGTLHYFRVRAVNSFGTALSPVITSSTLTPPTASSLPPTELAQTSVRFHGSVNARSFDSTVRFEWGTDGNAFPNSLAAVPASITGTEFTPVSAPLAGLVKGTIYYYRVVATNAGGTAVSGTQSFRTLTEPTAGIGGSFALSTTSVRVDGTVNAQGSSTSVVFEYGTDGVSFPNSVAATPANVGGNSSTAVSGVFTSLSQGATYHYRVRATSDGGIGYSPSASFSMNVLSGFTQVFPNAAPDAQGFIIVNLTPSTGVLHGWRFLGEQQWRASGVPVGGLATGDREIEFRAVPGYIHPPGETVSVVSGEAATVITRDYYETTTAGSSGVTVVLKPDSITTGPGRAQWRLLGEAEEDWRDSGDSVTGLIPGSYLIECKPVTGRATPPNANVFLSDGQTAVPTITYYLPASTFGVPPSVLAFENVSEDTSKPYAFVGQIRSNAGVGTGFVVKERVVATAAHVVWDDGTLSTAQGLQWLFQRHRGLHEPAPILPRGFYIFDGYAAQRMADNSPGDSSPQAQHLDAAALYFNEAAGRMGYGGFLASDLPDNEFLLSNANKMLIGYPVDGVSITSQGRMHASTPFNVAFAPGYNHPQDGVRTFITTGIRSSGGNSGGPLCVQFEGGAYYPAAIYLGGNNQTVVRAIDSDVVELFNRAATSSTGGGNNTGGGITHTSISTIASGSSGAVKVIIEPTGARNAGAGWRLSPETSYRISGAQKNSLNAGTYVLQLLTVPGYEPPAQQNVPVTTGNLTTLTYTYALPLTAQELWRQELFGSPSNSGSGADGADPDGDGFTNIAEYTAGTHPLRSFDHFKTENPQRSGNVFSVSTSGKAGRTYVLERSVSLVSGTWTTIATQGPLTYDTGLTLHDAASPPGSAFYRIRVTGP